VRLRGGQGGQGALGGPAGPVSWFFPTPIQTLLSETQGVRRSAPSRVRRPSEAPGSVKEGARRGPAAGSRVTRPKKGETARWRPPLRAGAVSRGAATAGAEGAWALRRLKAPGSAAGSWLPGNPAHGAGQAVGFRVTRPTGQARQLNRVHSPILYVCATPPIDGQRASLLILATHFETPLPLGTGGVAVRGCTPRVG